MRDYDNCHEVFWRKGDKLSLFVLNKLNISRSEYTTGNDLCIFTSSLNIAVIEFLSQCVPERAFVTLRLSNGANESALY